MVFTAHGIRVYDRLGHVVEQDDPSDATFDRDAAFVARTPELVAIRATGLGSRFFSLPPDGHTSAARASCVSSHHRLMAVGCWSPGRRRTNGSSSACIHARSWGRADHAAVRPRCEDRGLVLRGLIGLGARRSPASRRRSRSRCVGHSVRARAIVAYERGDPTAPVTLVVGVIHGNEPAGLAVIRQLRTMPLPAGVHLWLVPTLNPDGLAAGHAPERARRRPEPQLADRAGSRTDGPGTATTPARARCRSRRTGRCARSSCASAPR